MKIKIRVILKNNDMVSNMEYTAIKDDKKIIYKDKDGNVTLMLGSPLRLIRENNDSKVDLEFIPNNITKGNCLLKKENLNIDLEILTDYVIIDDIISIKYKVVTTEQDVVYKLEVLK